MVEKDKKKINKIKKERKYEKYKRRGRTSLLKEETNKQITSSSRIMETITSPL
jgi:hypothetical protein